MEDVRCEDCENYDYDDESETWSCLMELDMDEYEAYVVCRRTQCPFYRVRDDYRIVRRQN